MKIVARLFLITLLVAGCAPVAVQDRASPEPEYREPPVAQGISFSVSGEPTAAEECFVRYEIGYPEDIEPVELALELETEMKSDDGSWLGVAWTEGIRERVPSAEAVGNPRGGGVLHYIHMEELLLACDQVRFRMIVHACDPAPCPPITADKRSGTFEVQVDDRSPR